MTEQEILFILSSGPSDRCNPVKTRKSVLISPIPHRRTGTIRVLFYTRKHWLALLLTLATYLTRAQSPGADPVVEFLRQHPTRSALYVVRNDTVLISQRPDQKMPLASAVKTIIAIEFAQQAANGKIDPTEPIPLADLDRYYVPDTDGGAHPAWLKSLDATQNAPQRTRDSVALLDVAKGMIAFSSNANTEYLMDRLGLDALNARLQTLGLPNHDRLYPIVAALFLYSTNDPAATIARLRGLSPTAYAAECRAMHQKLKAAGSGALKRAFIFPNMALQKVWSDRLPAATVREYATVMQKINSRTYLTAPAQAVLDSIMEWPFVVNPRNRDVYRHLGMKGGSTAFVLTNAFYAETNRGDRIAAAVFFNDLTPAEMETLRAQFNNVILRCISKSQSAALAAALSK